MEKKFFAPLFFKKAAAFFLKPVRARFAPP
jgi:hypothetical protein